MVLSVKKMWELLGNNIINNVKILLIDHFLDDIFDFFKTRLRMVLGRYCKSLPRHVVLSEDEDLRTVAQLELIEVIKVWDPIHNEVIWPLAQTRIVGALRDHIRQLTRSNPSGVYTWINEQAIVYIGSREQSDETKTYDTKDQIRQAMQCLNERERYIVYAHMKQDLTFKVIGEKIDLSESQTSRVYKKSLQKLKKFIEKHS